MRWGVLLERKFRGPGLHLLRPAPGTQQAAEADFSGSPLHKTDPGSTPAGTTHRFELGHVPAEVLGDVHHLVDDALHLLTVEVAVPVGVVQPEHNCNATRSHQGRVRFRLRTDGALGRSHGSCESAARTRYARSTVVSLAP